ncbi:GNAT family N-acetyltransferase [Paenibacillus sophorae]|uniref:GNAT family N-acetyltransferase n=1 Tax=Paenibacillus sophorae TaxID=1333845 RepID=UPI0031BB4CFE
MAVENTKIGVTSLHILDFDLAEIRSLVVNPNLALRGIGKLLVNKIIEETRKLEIKRLISLTYQDAFFHKCGFFIVDKDKLPQKIWKDCINCSKIKSCDEIAMQINV